MSGRDPIKEMKDQRPYATQLIDQVVQFDIASFLEDIKDATLSMIPKGEHYSRRYSIDTNLTIIDRKSESTLPWIQLDIINDGPDILYSELNKDYVTNSPIELDVGEDIHRDFKAPLIHTIILWSEGNSDIRVYGVR